MGLLQQYDKAGATCKLGVTKGEDTFFAHRMAEGIGIEVPELSKEDQYYLQGLELNWSYDGQRWIRLASLHPESISYVDFYRNGELYYTSYDESFPINFSSNWRYDGVEVGNDDQEWKAVIYLGNGEVLERTAN